MGDINNLHGAFQSVCNLSLLSASSVYPSLLSSHLGKHTASRATIEAEAVIIRWLCNHNRNEESLAVIASLMGTSVDDVNARERYQEIRDTVLYERSVGEARWSDLFKKDELGTRHRLWIACSIQGLQQLAGNNAVN